MAVIADHTLDLLAAAAQQINYAAADIGSSLTCHEADALATIFTLCGNRPAAQALMDTHAATDTEEGDQHLHLHDNPEAIDNHLDDLTD